MILVNKENVGKYNEFLEKHDRCNFQQSVEWGRGESKERRKYGK